MNSDTRFDSIIREKVAAHFPELLVAFDEDAWLFVKAQIWQESRFDPLAVSRAGAQGLMQLMPATAKEMGVADPFNPEQNIDGGVRYLADQWRHLDEATVARDRLLFSFASYNGGRGYVNMAFVLGRDSEGLPASHKGWRAAGRPPGMFQSWGYAKSFLPDSRCIVHGRKPDYRQIWDYVSQIETQSRKYLTALVNEHA